MLDRSPTRFQGKKAAQHFQSAVSKVVDRVKSVAQWSANIRKLAKDHTGSFLDVINRSKSKQKHNKLICCQQKQEEHAGR
jgi:ABC-type uncharacterized transport system fused permease/ATPase subunit